MRKLVVATFVALSLPIPTPTADAYGPCGQWAATARSVGWSAAETKIVVGKIIPRETGGTCRPDLFNGRNMDRSYGLMQINTKGYLWSGHNGVRDLCRKVGVLRPADLLNPRKNLACGKQMKNRYGWFVLWRVRA